MQPVSSQPLRRCTVRLYVWKRPYQVIVTCPSGAYKSIRLCLRFIIRRTDTAWQITHSTLITPSAFLYPVSLAPQFGQNQAKGTQESLFSSTFILSFTISSCCLMVRHTTAQIFLIRTKYRYPDLRMLNYSLRCVSALFALHPAICLFQIQIAVQRTADRTLYVISLHELSPPLRKSNHCHYSARITCFATPWRTSLLTRILLFGYTALLEYFRTAFWLSGSIPP